MREAELLDMAESMVQEVLGRIRPEDADTTVPEMWSGTGPMTMSQAQELHAGWTVPADDLLAATIERSLLAHYVAAFLGSTACPLPEELARPLWELTAPTSQTWRERGYFRPPIHPLPDHVSWRDRFLLDAGHEAHPAGH